MYVPGNIIYFKPFYFKNGNTAKNKYCIVLHVEESEILIASLPTRTDSVPNSIIKQHGCINDDSINFNCYFFEKGQSITKCGWGFDLDTYIYGAQTDTYHLATFNEIYIIPGVDYDIIGQLTDNEYQKIVNCFKTSGSIKRKIKKLLK